MKRILYAVLLSVVVAAGVSCAGKRYVISEFTPLISEMAKFETMSHISIIERGNRETYSDSLSWVARYELDRILHSRRPGIPLVPEDIEFTVPHQGEFVGEEIDLLLRSIMDNGNNIRNIGVPPLITSMLKADGKRYGLIVIHAGFSRAKGNFGRQVAKDIGIGLLTGILSMGAVTYTGVTLKANSTLHAIIVDVERDRVAFYDTTTAEADPCDPEVLEKQVIKLFSKVFW